MALSQQNDKKSHFKWCGASNADGSKSRFERGCQSVISVGEPHTLGS